MLDNFRNSGTWDQQSLKRSFRESRFPKYFFNPLCTLRHIGSVLQYGRISGHKGRCGEAKNLPERVIPGHNCQDDSQWNVLNKAFGSIGVAVFRFKMGFGVFRVVIQGPCTFLDFGFRFDNRFPHFGCHDSGKSCFIAAQVFCRLFHKSCAFRKGLPPPNLKSPA